ncbi:hypothetical protein YC2023_052536 [Brassica napus]
MFDVLAETNPALAAMWQNVRPTINPDPTPEEQADLEQRSKKCTAKADTSTSKLKQPNFYITKFKAKSQPITPIN